MKRRIIKSGLLAMLFMTGSAFSTEILNSSYDVSRELYSALNPVFVQQWKQQTGDDLVIKQSHSGSSKQALAILQGLRADVVTYNQFTDVQILHDRGQLLAADWQTRLPNNSSPYHSTMGFLVRKGNPKQIKNWDDLAREDVKVVFPNPKTSGNGRYTYLAAWGAIQQSNGQDQQKTRAWMAKLLKNVVVFDIGGRGATTSFVERGLGDVLINFEAEVGMVKQQYPNEAYEVIIPPVDILAEFPVAWIDKNVDRNGTTAAAKAYLNFLYSTEAQKIITQFHYRVKDNALMAEAKIPFPETQLFSVDQQFGGWDKAIQTHFANGGILEQLLAEGHQ